LNDNKKQGNPTPALLGLIAIVTLLANLHARKQKLPIQQTAWYIKKLPIFSDVLIIVKRLFTHIAISKRRSSIMKSKKYIGLALLTSFLALFPPLLRGQLDKI
jgi:hypothetical protein